MEFGDEEVKFSGAIALLLYKYEDLFQLFFLFLCWLLTLVINYHLCGAFLYGIYSTLTSYNRFHKIKEKP